MILSLDPGLVNIGYSIYDEDNKKILKTGELVNREDSFLKKLKEIYIYFKAYFEKYSINTFVYEKPVFLGRGENGILISYCLAIILLLCSLNETKVFCYTPKKVKKEVTGEGTSDKHQVAKKVSEYFKIENKFSSNHASDSLAVLICYLKIKND